MVFLSFITQLYTPFSACFLPDLFLLRLLIGELEKERMGRTVFFLNSEAYIPLNAKCTPVGSSRLLRTPTQNFGLGI